MEDTYTISKENGRWHYRDLTEDVSVVLPDEVDCRGLALARDPVITGDVSGLLRHALANPVGTKHLCQIAKGAKTAGIIVSDATRAVSTPLVLPLIVGELQKAGISLQNMVLVVAIGVHRPATAEEMQAMAGEYHGKIKIVNHQPYDENELVYVGTTSFGNKITVNKTIFETDIRIGIGKVEPHEFAGFSGGRKSVLPGIASEETILYNHRPEMVLNPNSSPSILKDNPIHLDMVEAARDRKSVV